MGCKSAIWKLILGHRGDSESYVRYLRKKGVTVGERVSIFEPRKVCIDETRPYLIKIGNDVKITNGVTILTHGYDWNVLAGIHNVVLGSGGGVSIGNNVFIGMNTTILKGVHIGDNVVIGAGSLVNKNIPNDVVAAGNPLRIIMPVEDYYIKRVNEQSTEAFEIYKAYVERYGTEPPQDIYDEFFWLFFKREDTLPDRFSRQMKWHGKYQETMDRFIKSEPKFNGYEEFLIAARKYLDETRRK